MIEKYEEYSVCVCVCIHIHVHIHVHIYTHIDFSGSTNRSIFGWICGIKCIFEASYGDM